MRKILIILATVFCLVLSAIPLLPPASAAALSWIEGTVWVNDEPMGGVEITITGDLGTSDTTSTAANGTYKFADLPDDSYTIEATYRVTTQKGYKSINSVPSGKSYIENFEFYENDITGTCNVSTRAEWDDVLGSHTHWIPTSGINVTLWLWNWDLSTRTVFQYTETDENGHFEFLHLLEEPGYSLNLSATYENETKWAYEAYGNVLFQFSGDLPHTDKHKFDPFVRAEVRYNRVCDFDMLITDPAGHRLGYVGTDFFYEVPGGGQQEDTYTSEQYSIKGEANFTGLTYKVIAKKAGSYNLTIVKVDSTNAYLYTRGSSGTRAGAANEFKAANISVKAGEVNSFEIDWSKLESGAADAVKVGIDEGGDGTFEKHVSSDASLLQTDKAAAKAGGDDDDDRSSGSTALLVCGGIGAVVVLLIIIIVIVVVVKRSGAKKKGEEKASDEAAPPPPPDDEEEDKEKGQDDADSPPPPPDEEDVTSEDKKVDDEGKDGEKGEEEKKEDNEDGAQETKDEEENKEKPDAAPKEEEIAKDAEAPEEKDPSKDAPPPKDEKPEGEKPEAPADAPTS